MEMKKRNALTPKTEDELRQERIQKASTKKRNSLTPKTEDELRQERIQKAGKKNSLVPK